MNRFVVGSYALGAVLLTTGFFLMYHPLGFVASGTFLLLAAITASKGKK